LQVDHPEFPFPLVHRTKGVEKLLLAIEPEIAKLLGPGLAQETIELLAVNLEGPMPRYVFAINTSPLSH
jgi:hypothetical protein